MQIKRGRHGRHRCGAAIQSDGALTRPSEATKGLLTTNGTGETRFLRSPFTDVPASLSFRNTDVTISDQ